MSIPSNARDASSHRSHTAVSASPSPPAPAGDACPSGSALADAVLALARRAPSAVAVEDGTVTLDRQGLDRFSRRVAARLRDLGVRPGQAVAVCLPRSWRLVCVMLGIRRTGAAVVPLDRFSPPDRQQHILDDSGAVAVIHDGLPPVTERALPLDADALLGDGEPTARTPLPAGASPGPGDTETGFVFYTSGSTGRPKGVEITDAGVLRLAEPGYLDLRPGARYACLSNPAFDALSFEVWVPLVTGGVCVVLDDEQAHSPHRLAAELRDRAVDTLFITVALFDTVVERVPDCFAGVSQVLVGGEQLDARLIRRWYGANAGSDTVLHNVYGPTEATTFALCHPIPRDFTGDAVPLGTPLPGTRILLRTEDGRTAEPGEVAELLLSGPALAQGYRNLPTHTEQSFVTLPSPEDGEERWYRTGDLVRRDTQGGVVYVGRSDRQVKVRGFRIEPGEVERRILAHPAVRRAYVCTRHDSAERNELLAFVVLGGDLSFDAYDRHLTTGLPPYMRPHHTHLVTRLPLNANGKVDRDALLRDTGTPWRHSYEGEARVSDEQRPVLDLAEAILGVTGLRPDDRWIPHGGDSLKALRFRFEITRRFGVDLPQGLVLAADFATLAEAVHAPDAAAGGEHPPLPPASAEPVAPATREQERLWFLHQRDPEDRAYDVPLVFRVGGHVDPGALRRAVAGLVERHAALRTRLVPTPQGLRQRIGAPYDPWERFEGPDDARWRDLADRFFDHRFDLTDGRALRAAWVDGGGTGVLLLHLHHVAVDGWSLNLLFRDLGDAYTATLREESGGPVPPSAVTPLDFARWQREWRTSAAYEGRRARLGGRYGDPSPALAAPGTGTRPRARLLRTSLDLVHRAALDRLAGERGLTRFQILVSAFAASVYGVTGQERPLVATPVANRPRSEFADTVGMFANTALLELPLRPHEGMDAHLRSHAETVRAVLEDQEVALADLLSEPVLRERTPLFDYLFVLENTDFSALRIDGCEVRPAWPEPLGAKCALTLSVVEHESGFDCLWEYRDDIGAERAEAAARLFRRALDHLSEGGDPSLHELIADYRRGLPEQGRGEAPTPDFSTVSEGFARQVRATPHAPALTDGRFTLTYAELDAQANELATSLRASHRLPDDPAAPASVALHLRPSAEHVVALLAAARLNLTVVPLDPAYPATLLRHVLDQADPLCILVTEGDRDVLDTLAPSSLPRHLVALAGTPAAVPVPYAHEGLRPLYTLFTSGSTGVPKGVHVPDLTLCNLLTWQRAAGGLGRPARTQQFSMLSFDVCFQEILTTLCSGGLLHLVDPRWRHDMPALLEQLESAAVERIFLPYVALQLLAEHGVRTGRYPSRLREVVTAGEQLVCTDAIRRWFAGLPGARLFNHYGPTETHVVSALCLEGDPARWPPRPAIGRPVAGALLRVVDGSGHTVPPGATGELLIGGLMARHCYLGEDAGHPDRFSEDPGLGVLYRTGDLARFDERGLLHYVGRNDAQIKLSGQRLELGQVEAALLSCAGVVNAVATVADGSLVAVLECRGADPDPVALAEQLSALLPAHVRVARFRRATVLPRTPSGKLDRRAALTAPGYALRAQGRAVASLSPLEGRLTALFTSVTGKPIGVRQRYFDAGATSLDLMRFQLACSGEEGLSFSIPDLFEHVTPGALAGLLEGRHGGAGRPAVESGARPDANLAEEPVAVIGMAVRLPGAPDLAAFWDLVTSGRRGIEHFPATDGRVGARSQMDGLLAFDAGRFTISPGEARLMDPQQRHLLMSCVEALAHAGIGDPAGAGVGLIASCGENTYFQNMLRQGDPGALPDAFRLALHHEKDFLATKAAYHLGLTGPAFTVQSACSSSLVGVHLAAGMLRQGDCEVMLVGGVLVDTDLTGGYTYRSQHIFSPDGHCRPFSADAAGTVGGSGTGVVVLKPLSAARRDGDTVYAVVTGSGINNDGADKLGYSAPARSGQRSAIRAALRRSGRQGTDLGYVEAHGTGTALGDPVEAAALRDAYGLADDAGVALSSVKSQIGHLGAAAGVVGMVRAVLAVHHGVVPPTADFDRLNPEIGAGPFRVPVTAEPWPPDVPRVAAVSSFGIGGTNAHLLLERPGNRPDGPDPVQPPSGSATPATVPCLVLSASSEAALRADARRVADYLDAHPESYARVIRHLQAGRPTLVHRVAAVLPDPASASAWLRSLTPAAVPPDRTTVPVEGHGTRLLAEAWTVGHTGDWPAGPAAPPWDFPPPAFDTSEYDFPRVVGRPAPEPVPDTPRPRRLPAGQWLHQPQWTRLRRARIPAPCDRGTGDGPQARVARRIAVVVTPDTGPDARQDPTQDPGQEPGRGSPQDPRRDAGSDTWRFLEEHYARLVRVRPATTLGRLADDHYEADPGDTGQLAALLTLVTGRCEGEDSGTGTSDHDAFDVDWLHALPLALDGRVDERALEDARRSCLDTVAALSRALADLPEDRKPRVWLLSHQAQPVTGGVSSPLAGLLAAAVETPRQELGVIARWIDLPGPDPAQWAAHLPELLLDTTPSPRVVALRDGYWWHRPVQPVPALGLPPKTVAVEPGTHLLLGGTGGIGVTLAARLLEDPANRVVLVARGTTTPARLRPYGDRVVMVRADLATEDLDAIAGRLDPHLDCLSGIVHAAGSAAGGLLAGRLPGKAWTGTAAKLRGALLIERLLSRRTPGYVFYCSSMAAHHGGVGHFDYAAANACLDALAHYTPPAHAALPSSSPATVRMSLGWDIWSEVGMAQHAPGAGPRHQEHLEVALTPEEGAAVFAQALNLRLPHLMVSTTPLSEAGFFYDVAPSGQPTRAVQESRSRSDDPAAGLADVLCDLLGVDGVDPDASLYDLGADSLTLLELLEEVKRRYGTDIDLAVLGHRVTLKEILGKLDGASRPATETGEQAEAEVEIWQRGTGEDVLCLVHPVGGDIQAYRPLVSSLPAELTVCLIPDPALRDPWMPARSITDRAADYLRAVRAAFPQAGPRLRLAGWSFGAWTALSMAALAENDDRPVAGLYLLDPPPPGAGTEFATYDRSQVDEVFARELSGNRADGLTDSGRAYAERLARCCRANLAAMAEHRLPRINRTPTTVWLAERPMDAPVLAPRRTPPGAWAAHLPGTSLVHRVDADHYALVALPHARNVAAVLGAATPVTAQP